MKRATFKVMLRSLLRCDFARREDGAVVVEFVIILPMLFWAYLSMFSIFDAFRTYAIHQKAAYSIGDAISRETVPIDNLYLDGIQSLYEYMTMSEGRTDIRVSSVWYDAAEDVFNTDWSQTRGGVVALTSAETQNWHDKIPVMVDGEHVIITEVWSTYDPPFNTGLERREISNLVFTRPRYATCVLWVGSMQDGCAPNE